jgi:ribosome-associated translation inhibitor RaiA
MAQRMRERTIAFYEIVSFESGSQERFQSEVDWQSFLRAIENKPLTQRTWSGEKTLLGGAHFQDDRRHLLLHRVKDADEWLSMANFANGEVTELESKAGEGYLETSVVCFAGFGNIVGIMEGSASAPTHKSLAGWLNFMNVTEEKVALRPLMAGAEVDLLKRATGISRIEFRVGKLDKLGNKHGRLASTLKRLGQDYGDARVTLTISIPRGKPKFGQSDERQALYADVQELSDVIESAAERAKVKLLFMEGDDYGRARLTELVEHHVTAKRRVPAVDAQGNSIRIRGAIDAIMDETLTHEDELKGCLVVPGE